MQRQWGASFIPHCLASLPYLKAEYRERVHIMQTDVSPATVSAQHTMARIRRDEARRSNLRRHGVRSPLTRAELAATPHVRDLAPHARRIR